MEEFLRGPAPYRRRVRLCVSIAAALLLWTPPQHVATSFIIQQPFIFSGNKASGKLMSIPAATRTRSLHMSEGIPRSRGYHAGGSVNLLSSGGGSTITTTTATSSVPTGLSSSLPYTSNLAPPLGLEARVIGLEGKLRVVEKQLERMEALLTRRAGRKSVTLTYDLGPDANIDSEDVAKGAAAAFGFIGMILGRSLARNLWLVSGVGCGALAAYLCREEEGGFVSDRIRAVGYDVALKTRQYLFMWRTGKLSYVYLQRWEALDKRYAIMKKVDAVKALSLAKYAEAKEAERKHEVGRRLLGFLVASVHVTIDGTAKLFNAKDRMDLILKLPRPLRNLLTTKKQRRDARERKYRVKFCGFREWRPLDDED